MRDVPGGWFIRYMHSTGASFFFIVVYLHMFRALLYGSYRTPREMVWIFGCLIFLVLMGEAFFGYLLPWGQMSYWGAQVIVNLFSAIPVIGPDLSVLIRGDYVVSDATLNRFFALHVIAFPLVLVGWWRRTSSPCTTSARTTRMASRSRRRSTRRPASRSTASVPPLLHGARHHGLGVFLIVFFAVLFFMPEMGGYFLEWNNFIPADPLQTPPHIAPVWYFTPFYSILRATTEPFMLVLAAGLAVYALLLFFTLRSRPAKFAVLGVAAVVIVLMSAAR